MKKHISLKKIYLFTIVFFIIFLLFIYIFANTAEQFYTGWDMFTNKNILSIFADTMFIFLLSVNFIGIILCIFYSIKSLFNKINL